MKKINLLLITGILVTLLFSACTKQDDVKNQTLIEQILGTYNGALSISNSLKSLGSDSIAYADITPFGDGQVQVHCFGEDFDTTIVLDYYENHDSIMVCMTGEAFKKEYGHMNGNMMGHGMHSNTETDWMHHLEDEHVNGDKHYGMFDLDNHSFEYSFKLMHNDSIYYRNFNGIKN